MRAADSARAVHLCVCSQAHILAHKWPAHALRLTQALCEKTESDMTIHLLDVDESNWRECVELKVAEEQKTFVDPNVFPIAEWKFEPENTIKAIYSNSELVGMLAYYYHDGAYGEFYWLYHLMIEPSKQGKGYGQASVKLAIIEMRELGAKEIVTNCVPKNVQAQYLYRKLGFKDNGIIEGGDLLLLLPESA